MNQLSHLTVNHKGFAFDPVNGEGFSMNKTAAVILGEIQRGESAQDIAGSLAKSYEVTLKEALRDIQDFRSRLKGLEIG